MRGVLIQLAVAIFLNLVCSMSALISVWPSYTIRILESDHSPLGFKISKNAANLIGSIPMLGSLISTVVAGYVAETIGRKKAIMSSGLFYTVGWSLIVTARSTLQILVARFMMGLGGGLSVVTALLYTSEITHMSLRGSTAVMTSLLSTSGIMISYLEGWFWSYDVICYVNLTGTVIHFILTCFLKESPIYLIKIGKEKEALKSLKFYRGVSKTNEAILEEFSYLKNQANQEDADPGALLEKERFQNFENENAESNAEKKNIWILLLTAAHIRRAVVSSVTFTTLVCAMGVIAVQTYASKFFMTAAPSLSPDLCSVIFSLILVVANILSSVVMNSLPRRTLMTSTCLVTTICLVILGAAMRWPVLPSWVTLSTALIYVIAFHLGVINVVIVQLSESYGAQVKSAVTVLVMCSFFLTNFVVLFLFPPSVEYIGIDNTFFVFAGVAGFTTVLSYFWIQETRQVPYEQVEKMYKRGIMYKKVKDIET